MELLLNLLWLVMALVALALWRRRWTHDGRAAESQTRRGWIALGCALVLLFFVISLTDDLHAEVVLVEDSSVSRRQVCSAHGGSHSGVTKLPCPHVFLLERQDVFPVLPEVIGRISNGRGAPAHAAMRFVAGRSPPFSSL